MISNSKYYIHKNSNGTYSIWTIDDMYKMTNDIATREQAEKLLSIMPNTILNNLIKENANDNRR